MTNRDRFEKAMLGHQAILFVESDFDRDDDGDEYLKPHTQYAWAAWQAALASRGGVEIARGKYTYQCGGVDDGQQIFPLPDLNALASQFDGQQVRVVVEAVEES